MDWFLYDSDLRHERFKHVWVAEAHPETRQRSKLELFEKVLNNFQPLTIFVKISILDFWIALRLFKLCFQLHLKLPRPPLSALDYLS